MNPLPSTEGILWKGETKNSKTGHLLTAYYCLYWRQWNDSSLQHLDQLTNIASCPGARCSFQLYLCKSGVQWYKTDSVNQKRTGPQTALKGHPLSVLGATFPMATKANVKIWINFIEHWYAPKSTEAQFLIQYLSKNNWLTIATWGRGGGQGGRGKWGNFKLLIYIVFLLPDQTSANHHFKCITYKMHHL